GRWARGARQCLRGITAVGRAVVVEIFVGQLDLRAVVGRQRNRRINAVTLEMVEVAEGVGAFIEDVQPRGDVLVDRLPRIQRDTAIAPGAGLRCRFIDARAVGLLERAVDEAATGSATEGNRGRPFQDLDALRVV